MEESLLQRDGDIGGPYEPLLFAPCTMRSTSVEERFFSPEGSGGGALTLVLRVRGVAPGVAPTSFRADRPHRPHRPLPAFAESPGRASRGPYGGRAGGVSSYSASPRPARACAGLPSTARHAAQVDERGGGLVPKKDLAGSLQVLLGGKRIKVAQTLE
jgi:hypothetical protein